MFNNKMPQEIFNNPSPDPLKRAEEFAIKLRKKKKREILAEKRSKLVTVFSNTPSKSSQEI